MCVTVAPHLRLLAGTISDDGEVVPGRAYVELKCEAEATEFIQCVQGHAFLDSEGMVPKANQGPVPPSHAHGHSPTWLHRQQHCVDSRFRPVPTRAAGEASSRHAGRHHPS